MVDDVRLKSLFGVGLGFIVLGLGGFLVGPFSLAYSFSFTAVGVVDISIGLYGLTKSKIFEMGMYLSFLVWLLLFIHLFTDIS